MRIPEGVEILHGALSNWKDKLTPLKNAETTCSCTGVHRSLPAVLSKTSGARTMLGPIVQYT